jgi:hypothetical protein
MDCNGEIVLIRFGKQKVHMLRHHYVSVDPHSETAAHFFKGVQK